MASGHVKTERQKLKWIIAVEEGLHFADVVFLCMDDVMGYGQPSVPAFLCAVQVCFIS